jgi:exopolysaccharide biosynthesis predicted pyruvyltransferase EpsI
MREDEEQTDHPRAADNIDLSKEIPFELEMLSGAAAEQTSRLFFEFLEEWDVVHTNRLHVAIAAGLLDKRVHLYANANPKNESMYRDVLSDRFPKLSWEG